MQLRVTTTLQQQQMMMKKRRRLLLVTMTTMTVVARARREDARTRRFGRPTAAVEPTPTKARHLMVRGWGEVRGGGVRDWEVRESGG